MADIFDKMADFYAYGDGYQFNDADSLFVIYDELAEIYGAQNDYEAILNDDAELEKLYKALMSGQAEEQ